MMHGPREGDPWQMRDVYPMRRVWETGSKDEGSKDATRRQPLQSNRSGCTKRRRP